MAIDTNMKNITMLERERRLLEFDSPPRVPHPRLPGEREEAPPVRGKGGAHSPMSAGRTKLLSA